jgi:sec-independent protein translocase protein TatC
VAQSEALPETIPARVTDVATVGGADATPPSGGGDATMSLVDHLSELRWRLFVIIAAVGAFTIVAFTRAERLLEILKAPLGNKPLYFTGLGDAFVIQLKLAIVVGLVAAMPIILFEAWRFISPGLTPAERRAARPWVPFALLFFVAGVSLAYVILPYASGYLLSFTVPGVLESLITADKYFDFVSTLFLAFGIVMEFPIVLILLSKVGIVTSARLRRSRRYALLAIAVFALLATPGGDIVSPIALGVILYGLYEGSILAVRFGGK